MQPVDYILGLDLGQAQDFTALAVLERHGRGQTAVFHARHLHRFPLGTKYPAIVADVAASLSRDPLKTNRPALAIDTTGVGAPVVDMFRRERLNAYLWPIFIHGGDAVTSDGDVRRVPKRELVGVVQVALQTSRLKIAPDIAEANTLVRELQNFQVKISAETAHDSYGAWREGTHDDLVLAVAMALWVGSRPVPPAPAVAGSRTAQKFEMI